MLIAHTQVLLSSAIVLTIFLLFLVNAETIDKNVFHRSSQEVNALCTEEDGSICSKTILGNRFQSVRRFLVFECVVMILGIFTYFIIHQRHKRLDEKLRRKVNLQIASGV